MVENQLRHCSVDVYESTQAYRLSRLVLEQIVELLLAVVFGIGLCGNPAGRFDNVAHLEEIAEVVLLFVGDRRVDILTALGPSGRVKMPAAATTP